MLYIFFSQWNNLDILKDISYRLLYNNSVISSIQHEIFHYTISRFGIIHYYGQTYSVQENALSININFCSQYPELALYHSMHLEAVCCCWKKKLKYLPKKKLTVWSLKQLQVSWKCRKLLNSMKYCLALIIFSFQTKPQLKECLSLQTMNNTCVGVCMSTYVYKNHIS